MVWKLLNCGQMRHCLLSYASSVQSLVFLKRIVLMVNRIISLDADWSKAESILTALGAS